MPRFNRRVTAETLLWGIADRESGGRVAEELARQVTKAGWRQRALEEAESRSLEVRFGEAGLNASEVKAAWLAAGALFSSGERVETIAEDAVRICRSYSGAFLREFSDGVAWCLSQQGWPAANVHAALYVAGMQRYGRVTEEISQWAADRSNNPQAGLACGSFLRPETLFTELNQMVVCVGRSQANPTGLEEVATGKLKVVSLDQFLTSKNEILIGFGKPNVFTLIPPAAGAAAYQKLDAFMFYRKQTRITQATVAQSGVFVRVRNQSVDFVEALRGAMRAEEGKRTLSCAKANARMLARAGLTSGGVDLASLFRPYKLFLHVVRHGLEFAGRPVEFDIINTTPGTVAEHFTGVLRKEWTSPLRAVEKACCEGEQRSPAEAAALQSAKAMKPVASPVVPVVAGVPLRMRISRPAEVAVGLRRYWGEHVLWEALPDRERVDVDRFLPEVLKDKFTLAAERGVRLKKVDRVKRYLFSRPVVSFVRRGLARHFDEMGSYYPAQIKTMLPAAGPGETPVMFNLVVCGPKVENRVSITQVTVDKAAPDWVLSKHVLVAGYDPDVRFAGEIWAERYAAAADGGCDVRLHLNNNSGTYHPTAEQARAAAAYLAELLPGVEVVAHGLEEAEQLVAAAAGEEDHQRTYAVSPEQYRQLRQGLDGRRVTLRHDAAGEPQEFTIRRYGSVVLDTVYFDTADEALRRAGAMLRVRRRAKEIELEAKVQPAAGGPRRRARGATARTEEEWERRQEAIWGAGSGDAAVRLARSVAGADARFAPVVWKNTRRELYLVSPRGYWGRLRPGFVLSLDCSTAGRADGGRRGEASEGGWHVLEPQLFTKLPWTRAVTAGRLAQFADLCGQLAAAWGLEESARAGYEEAAMRARGLSGSVDDGGLGKND